MQLVVAHTAKFVNEFPEVQVCYLADCVASAQMGQKVSRKSSKMANILIVYAHQLQHKSFNGALKDTAVEILQKQGHTVVVSDLYAQNFNPVASKSDTGRTGKN